MKGIHPLKNGHWRVNIMVNGERMSKTCKTYDEALHVAAYIRLFLNLKHQGQRGQIMYAINENGQIENSEGRIIANANEAAQNANTGALQTFTFPVTGQGVRIIEKDGGEPWFVAKDVCDCLAIKNGRDAMSDLDEDEKGVALTDTLGGRQKMATVSESGMYGLIMKSRKPEARAFTKWVRAEVLPAIRRTGGYMIARPEDTPEELLSRALIIAKEALDRKTLALDVAQPKANKYDKFLDTSGTLNLTQAAKQLGVSAMTLGKALREGSSKWLFKTEKDDINMPMQPIIDKGYMVVISMRKAKTGQVFTQGRFTTKGMNALFEQFGRC